MIMDDNKDHCALLLLDEIKLLKSMYNTNELKFAENEDGIQCGSDVQISLHLVPFFGIQISKFHEIIPHFSNYHF